jgi:NADH-quinone oxidoreductase subunit H
MNIIEIITSHGEQTFGQLWPIVWALLRIVIIVLPMFACVAYLTLWERKLIGWMHVRMGNYF